MRTLAKFGAAILLLAALLTGAGLAILHWPGLVLNERALGLAARLAERAGYPVTWKTASIQARSLSLLRDRIDVTFTDICVSHENRFGACFSEVSLSGVLGLAGFVPRLRVIGPGRFAGGKFDLVLAPANETPSSPEGGRGDLSRLVPPTLLKWVALNPIEIEINHWRVRNGAEDLRGDLRVSLREDDEGRPTAHVRAAGSLNTASVRLDAEVRMHRPLLEIAESRLWLDHVLNGTYTVGAPGAPDRVRVALAASGSFGADLFRSSFSGAVSAGAREFALNQCLLEIDRLKTALDCPLRLPAPAMPQGWPSVPLMQMPRELATRLKADLTAQSFPPSPSELVSGKVSVSFDPFQSALFEGGGSVEADIAGIPERFPDGWKLDTDMDLSLRISDFAKIVNALQDTSWAVPAPFQALHGKIDLLAHGRGDLQGGKIPLVLKTRLASARQRFDIDVHCQVDLMSPSRLDSPGAVKLTAAVALLNVRVQLPRLAAEAPPRLLPDQRIHPPAGPEEGNGSLRYNVAADTPPGHPVIFLSNLAKTSIPLEAHLRFGSGSPFVGTVEISKFPLELFHRTASLEHFRISLKPKMDDSPVDVSIQVVYTDYTVTVLVLGTLGKPQLQLSSTPPLPEEQLYAVLLFGKPLDELDPDQSASVGSAQSALADGALNMASLYVLASTPIQSIGYDPASGGVSVKIRLGAGTSLNVGSAAGSFQDLGIRKRLGSHWTISTDLQRPTGTADLVASAYLEWNYRY